MKIKCWQYKNCGKTNCPVYGNDNLNCWVIPNTLCDESAKHDLESRMEACINCEVLRLNMLEILKEVPFSDEILKPFYAVFKQLEEYKTQIMMCHTISKLMQSTIDLEKILHIILTCVTASYGLSFNRAILLLANKSKDILDGVMAVGPTNKEEAYHIWNELSPDKLPLVGFDNIIEVYNGVFRKKDTPINLIAQKIHISIKKNNIFLESINNKQAFIITDARRNQKIPIEFIDIWGAEIFAVVPFISKAGSLGVIVADNLYNERPITAEHIELLKGFASQAGLAIDNAMLYENLENKLEEVENLNIKLREINEMLLRSEKLSAIGEMASTTAHEIRSPLISIGGFARLIKDEANRETLNSYADIIINEVNRLEKIIGSILDFVKPTKLMFKQTNINKLVEQTLFLLNHDLNKYNIEKEINFDNNLQIIIADEERIKQVLINIFNNAIEAMKESTIKKISVATYKKGNFIKIEIRDTGGGISKLDLDNICKPFFTTKEEGVGLGLYIADKIVREHDGLLEIKSELGVGTLFIINLPVERRINNEDSISSR